MNVERKPKKCRNKACGNDFYPFNSMDAHCSPKCKIEAKKAKEEAKANKLPKLVKGSEIESPRKLQWDIELTDKVFNAFICVRDRYKPCISCGKPLAPGETQCGHFRTKAAASQLRYNADNAHGQCDDCNCRLSGNRVKMEEGMVFRIGAEKVEALKNNNLGANKDPVYLKRIRKVFALKKRKLERSL